MKYSDYIKGFQKEFEAALSSLNGELGKKKEKLSYASAIGNLIVALGRIRTIPRLNSKETLLLEKAENTLTGIRWNNMLKGYSEQYFTERLSVCKVCLEKFDDGLESFGNENLSKLAREVVLSRDAISILTAWRFASGRKFPGTKREDRYPFDERIRDLLPDMDMYLNGWREKISSFKKVTWVWKERSECLSSVALVQIQEGSFPDMRFGKAHLNSCKLCGTKYRSIDIPELDKAIVPVAVHPSEKEFALYKRLQLSEPARKAIERHVDSCLVCRKRVSEAPAQVGSVQAAAARAKVPVPIVRLRERYKDYWARVRDIVGAPFLSPSLQAASGVEESGGMEGDRLLSEYLWQETESTGWMYPRPGGLEIHVSMGGKKAPLYFQVTDASGIRVKWDRKNRRESESATVFSIDLRRNPLPLSLSIRCGKYRKFIRLEK